MSGGAVGPSSLLDELIQLIDRDLSAGPEIIRPAGALRKSGDIGADEIANIHIVASLSAIAIDQALFAREQALGEDGDHACFSVRVLPWAIDIGVTEHDVGKLELLMVI